MDSSSFELTMVIIRKGFKKRPWKWCGEAAKVWGPRLKFSRGSFLRAMDPLRGSALTFTAKVLNRSRYNDMQSLVDYI